MKIVIVLLAGLLALATSNPQQNHQITDSQFLQRQRDVLRLFNHVNQPSYYQDHVDIANNYHLQNSYDNFTRPEVARQYYQYYQYGLLPRGQVFSVFYEEHLQQAIALYRVLYYAKDYATFYNTAVWARQNVNEGVFLYAVSVAIVHRPDTYGIILPPIYEIYPHYFYNNEVIQQAYRYKQQHHGQNEVQGQPDNGYTINANYSGYYLNLHPEQSLSYFTEDVGINSFYYYYNIYYPHWLGGEDYDYQNDRRGEQYYYIHQQLLARYYLERLSNEFGEVPIFNYEVPFETGYYPSLQYPNGLPFPSRPNHANLHEYFYNYGQRYGNSQYVYSYTHVQDYEKRIRDAIDRGYVYTSDGQRVNLYTQEGVNVLGNLVQSNPDSPDSRYYGALHVYARHLLGYSYQPLNNYQVAPSALEHYETSLRDPAFYQFYQRVLSYFRQYQNHFPHYTPADLEFEGVEVTNVEFDRLVTYFDYFYSDLSNAIYVTPEEYQQQYEQGQSQIRVRQQRLNHRPFNYRIQVNSNQAQEAVVRVYIGPKYDEYGRRVNISQNRQYFVQFDHFRHQLQAGQNNIERSSHQVYGYQDDRTSYRQLYQQVLSALSGEGELSVNAYKAYYPYEAYYGFPRRYLLPSGSYGGVEYQFYVIVSPYVPPQQQEQGQQQHQQQQQQHHHYPRVGSGAQFVDGYPLGYPFNRPVQHEQVYYNISNAYVHSARVYHRHVEDINASTANQN